jgi:hypothetical protein
MALRLYRTQLFMPEDISNVWAIQDQFKIRSLSNYLEAPVPKPLAPLEFIEPI